MGESYRFGFPTLMEKWPEEDCRRQRSRKTKKRRRKRARFTSKKDEYKKQKPCCKSNGKLGH